MKPIDFPESNCNLLGTGNVGDLRVLRDGTFITSCWRLSWRDRLSVLFFGRVWLSIMTPRTHPPIALRAARRLRLL